MTYSSEGSINRYYDPSTDSFISVDPAVLSTDQPYVFVNDNPLNLEDPLGFRPTSGGSQSNLQTQTEAAAYAQAEAFATSQAASKNQSKNLSTGLKMIQSSSSVTPQVFANAILTGVGAPISSSNQLAIVSWECEEGGNYSQGGSDYSFNPLNATQAEAGSTQPSATNRNIQAYTSWVEGYDATVETLEAGDDGYPNILAALYEGNSSSNVFTAIDDSSWGTKDAGACQYNYDDPPYFSGL